jgi:lipopolysaccharide transport system ATP-binding protein
MSSDAVAVSDLSKCYHIYNRPQDRLTQGLENLLARARSREPRRLYREFWALRDVSFSVARGETMGIIGRNGSGKSTLLQLICGIIYPTSGNVMTFGRVAALLELGAGFNPEFTGRENVYHKGALLGLSRAEMDDRFDDILAFSEIESFIDQPVKQYSSGMYIRLAFAISICVDPDILIVDEALAVGDALFQNKCFRRIKELQEGGVTILFVSHSEHLVARHCDRALLLERGQVVCVDSAKAAIRAYYGLLYPPSASAGVRRESQATGESGAERSDAGGQSDPEQVLSNRVAVFRSSESHDDLFSTRRFYNPREQRVGSGGARVIDAMWIAEGQVSPSSMSSGAFVELYVKYHFAVALAGLVSGVEIRTTDRLLIFGGNTLDVWGGTFSAEADSVRTLRFAFSLPLLAGTYFVSVGVSRNDGSGSGRIIPVDRRIDGMILNLTAAGPGHGLCDCRLRIEK